MKSKLWLVNFQSCLFFFLQNLKLRRKGELGLFGKYSHSFLWHSNPSIQMSASITNTFQFLPLFTSTSPALLRKKKKWQSHLRKSRAVITRNHCIVSSWVTGSTELSCERFLAGSIPHGTAIICSVLSQHNFNNIMIGIKEKTQPLGGKSELPSRRNLRRKGCFHSI